MNERINERVTVFAVRHQRAQVLGRMTVDVEKRRSSKNPSTELRGPLDRGGRRERTGPTSYHGYCNALESNLALRTIPGVGKEIGYRQVAARRNERTISRPLYKAKALRVTHEQLGCRLALDARWPLGPVVQEPLKAPSSAVRREGFNQNVTSDLVSPREAAA